LPDLQNEPNFSLQNQAAALFASVEFGLVEFTTLTDEPADPTLARQPDGGMR